MNVIQRVTVHFWIFLYDCHLDNVIMGHKFFAAPLCGHQQGYSWPHKQTSLILDPRPLIIHIELKRTLFIKAVAPGNLCGTPICVCLCGTRMREEE